MQHLEAERLAALDHDAPSSEELAHLAACAVCRAERDAYGELRLLAQDEAARRGADGTDSARLTSWDSLSHALRREGLLTSTFEITPTQTPLVVRALHGAAVPATVDGTTVNVPPVMDATRDHAVASTGAQGGADEYGAARRDSRDGRLRSMTAPSLRWTRGWSRAAAAVLLVLGGAMAGRVSAGGSAVPLTFDGGAGAATDASNVSVGVALQGTSFGGREAFASVDEATDALTEAQRVYERASLWLASNDTTTRSAEVYRARLAALDQMMAASRSALRDAPQDPVLNHYFLAAYTAREATLQQMTSALPVDKTIESY